MTDSETMDMFVSKDKPDLFDIVKITDPDPDDALKEELSERRIHGTVVDIHENPIAYEVEFNLTGEEIYLLVCQLCEVELVQKAPMPIVKNGSSK